VREGDDSAVASEEISPNDKGWPRLRRKSHFRQILLAS
jgi:hypothetical protein